MIKNMQEARPTVFAPEGKEADEVQVEVLPLDRLLSRFPASWFAKPERLQFHLIMLVGDRPATHEVDFEVLQLRARSALVLAPGQVHRFVAEPTFAADLVLVAPSAAAVTGVSLMVGTGGAPVLLVSEERDQPALTELIRQLRSESCTVSAMPIKLATVAAMVARLRRLQSEQGLTAHRSERFSQFASLVDEHHATHRDVEWYAEQLHCTAQTLTRTCRMACGVGAKLYVNDRVILEAQRMLAVTDIPVGSIGRALGFPEPTNFVRFFRRTGRTPAQFRRLHRPI